jgi:3-deoxy-D-arabino-heptulosonate 7-phosphate (DAHP) synthase
LTQDPDKFETIMIESKVREGYFHKVVKDLENGKSVSCSCKCWSKGGKPCAAMRSIGY